MIVITYECCEKMREKTSKNRTY